MLKEKQMQGIKDLKLQGYTISEISQHYTESGLKPPSLPTIRKYFRMDVLPEKPNENLQKDKAFDREPFRSAILTILTNNKNKKNVCMSSVYDVLQEKFIESGNYSELPGNEQTLRNYIHYLNQNGMIAQSPKELRIYDHVFDTPPGQQLLIDFGQTDIAPGITVHFICLLLRYSRYLVVLAQDHKYNAEEACQAIYRAFCKLGGRPTELVIDQDAVFVATETYGEVIKTRVFEDFCTEQELKLWVCHKADPESKGPIENSVGFVKKNFFSARSLVSIEAVWKSLPGWLSRKNKRIHQATFCVPLNVFNELEKEGLRPLLPSMYENSPSSFVAAEIGGTPYIQYKSCKYSVPRDCCFHTIYFKPIRNKLIVYDENRKYLCTHALSECKGIFCQLPEHRKQPSTAWLAVAERLRKKWNCYDFQHFVNGVKKENPRYICQQLTAIEDFLDKEKPELSFVAIVFKQCCETFRYRFSQFKVTYQLVKDGQVSGNAYTCSDVQTQDLSFYAQAFKNRCSSGEKVQQ